MRYAIIYNITAHTAERYLPGNYAVVSIGDDGSVLIAGEDRAGWTLDDYVLPRLASGLYHGREVPPPPPCFVPNAPDEICDECGEERRALIHTDTTLDALDAADGLYLHPFKSSN
jgi:hypothetical protein